MSETKERNGIWQAEFWANGKRIRKSTGIAVGATRAEQRTLALTTLGGDCHRSKSTESEI